jgi:cation:H+ antiporter
VEEDYKEREIHMVALVIALGLLVAGCALLLRGADWFMDGAVDLARALGVSALVIGVLLAGLEPEEMLTAAVASARGAPALAVGNVIGTNVTIVTLALGLSALIFPVLIDRSVRRQALIATLVSVIPIVLLFLGTVTRLAGVLLLIIFAGYTFLLWRVDRTAMQRLAESEIDEDDNDDGNSDREQYKHWHFLWQPLLLTFGGLAAMVIGGPAVVEGALRLANLVNRGQGVVGATIVSLGTGAEMLALGVSAARRRQAEILVGGILGSFAYNLLVTLGLAAALHTIPVYPPMSTVALPIMVVVHLLLLILIWYGKIPRLIGGVLIAVYSAYLLAVVLV